jgi:hypothetical protein
MAWAEAARLDDFDLNRFKAQALLSDRYERQLKRLQDTGIATGPIETAVTNAVFNIDASANRSLVIYGEPQSGKTEMMICLTGKLLDQRYPVIVHLLNDSVDLLTQNLTRFKTSGLAPAAKTLSELPESPAPLPSELVVFCKKNARDLEKLIQRLADAPFRKIVVVDDEADFATPNGRVNSGQVTTINNLIRTLLGADGFYIGVTATPARLDLNNTFETEPEQWVRFPAHDKYTGQDIFFPLQLTPLKFRLKRIGEDSNATESQAALVRFLATVGYLNKYDFAGPTDPNWSMLVHTSGKKSDHKADQAAMEESIATLRDANSAGFGDLVKKVFTAAKALYTKADPNLITEYVVRNASRTSLVILNSERDRKAMGDNATTPTSPFTIIIGGNIVSRGVTFPNLLAMFFTRDVKQKLQQDTYIQRARMFGARGAYLEHFELTIPAGLYEDWRRCFIFHRLALQSISTNRGAPVWIGDKRVSVASSSSIDRTTVVLDKGEMSFGMFDYSDTLDAVVTANNTSTDALSQLRERVGDGSLPQFLIDYIKILSVGQLGALAIHTSSSIDGYESNDVDKPNIRRRRGFIGTPQLELRKFPNATHHIKILYNAERKARVFYKYTQNVSFTQNMR